PVITTQPANKTVTVGQAATFTVVATGSPLPTYQWRKGGAAISGATLATYTTPAPVAEDDGAVFDVIVTNSVGTVISNPATLRVGAVGSGPAWLNAAWLYRNPVTISNPSATDLSAFQVNVTLASTFDFTKPRSDGGDVRFTDSDGVTLLPYWIEGWNPGSN